MRRRDRKQVIFKGLNTTRSSIGRSSVAAQNAKVRVRSETEPDLSIIEGKFDAKMKQNGGWKLPAALSFASAISDRSGFQMGSVSYFFMQNSQNTNKKKLH